MKETILIGLGGTIMLPKPSISSYLEEQCVSNANISMKWNYALDGLRRGDIIPRLIDDVEYAIERLAANYALSIFSDGPDEFNILCLRTLRVKSYFPSVLMIPNSVLMAKGKKNPLTWDEAKAYLEKKGHTPVACADGSLEAINASQLSGIKISSYLIDPQANGTSERSIDFGDASVKYVSVRSLRGMASHFLDK